jgi:dephospho-CoA kinase
MQTNTIGIAGYKGCGKSLVADYLCQARKFEILKFADPLKDMLRAIGLSDSHIEGERSTTVSPLW